MPINQPYGCYNHEPRANGRDRKPLRVQAGYQEDDVTPKWVDHYPEWNEANLQCGYEKSWNDQRCSGCRWQQTAEDDSDVANALARLRPIFEAEYGRDRTRKDLDGKDHGQWLDMAVHPLGTYQSMVTEYAWRAFCHAHLENFGLNPNEVGFRWFHLDRPSPYHGDGR